MNTPTAYLPPKAPCPHCGNVIAINRLTSALRPHGPRYSCPGSRMPAVNLTPEDRESWRTGDVYEVLDRYQLDSKLVFKPYPNMDPDDELTLLINHNRRIILAVDAYAREHV
jgi:hypothetical protein